MLYNLQCTDKLFFDKTFVWPPNLLLGLLVSFCLKHCGSKTSVNSILAIAFQKGWQGPLSTTPNMYWHCFPLPPSICVHDAHPLPYSICAVPSPYHASLRIMTSHPGLYSERVLLTSPSPFTSAVISPCKTEKCVFTSYSAPITDGNDDSAQVWIGEIREFIGFLTEASVRDPLQDYGCQVTYKSRSELSSCLTRKKSPIWMRADPQHQGPWSCLYNFQVGTWFSYPQMVITVASWLVTFLQIIVAILGGCVHYFS